MSDEPKITMENDSDLLVRAGGAVDPSEGVRPPAPPRKVVRKGDMFSPPTEPIAKESAPLQNPVLPGGGLIEPPPPESPVGDLPEEALTSGQDEEILPPLAASAQPEAPQLRPGNYDQLPDAQALYDTNRRRNIGSVVVEINHEMLHRERRVVEQYHIVTSDPKRRMPVGTGFANGIPLTIFGVPVETGRRYRITVEETSDSAPQPKRVPWGKGQSV